ncbi:hypothetical protein H0H81_004307 [Sphagnurus paluster]|uniref:Uncharacterized protein n=1 Tax=Sphagnurus paluster TaxID=117069 RepID=A0A9P7GT12_9AGAR|nr:hypothetical protein H0H81_004307 [Sphagnurus paluster]
MQLIVEPRDFEDDPAKQYRVIDASVVAIADVQAENPALEVVIDPLDFTRLRYVVILQNSRGDRRRLRLVQWNVLSTEKYRRMDMDASAALSSSCVEVLIDAVETLSPCEVLKMFGK